MQPIKYLAQWLTENANKDHFLFTLMNLRTLFPHLSIPAVKTLLNRAVTNKLLLRVCRGIYLYPPALRRDGQLLFHVAALMRANNFNYISLETTLSDAGVISQIPINWISIMSSSRSNVISCGKFGTIEFIHTCQQPVELASQLIYDYSCGLWRANVSLALKDMKRTHRNCDLIDWEVANEFIR